MSESELTIKKFPPGVRILIDVVFPGEYRIGWEYGVRDNKRIYTPGSGSYYSFDLAMDAAWLAFEKNVLSKRQEEHDCELNKEIV